MWKPGKCACRIGKNYINNYMSFMYEYTNESSNFSSTKSSKNCLI